VRGGWSLAVLAAVVLASGAVTTAGAAPGALDGSATAGAAAIRSRPPPRSFSVVATGDILTESSVLAAMAAHAGPGQRYDLGPLLAPVAPLIRSADLAICHIELPMGRPGDPPLNLGDSEFGGNRLVSPYEVAGGVAATGYDRCSTSSNHSNDIGAAGIVQTLDALDDAGLSHVGSARTPAEAVPQIVDVNGVRVAHLADTTYTNTSLDVPPWQLNYVTDPQRVIDDVRAVRAAGAEVVIVSLHLRVELQHGPTAEDRAFVTALTAAAPVDVVVMHGPHVVQPVERVNGALVFWSVGNLISGMGTPGRAGRYDDPRTLDGLIADVRFTETSPGLFTGESWPILVCVDPATRVVHAPVTELADPATPAARRPTLQACIDRTLAEVPDLH
jgi:hypothetical protein